MGIEDEAPNIALFTINIVPSWVSDESVPFFWNTFIVHSLEHFYGSVAPSPWFAEICTDKGVMT